MECDLRETAARVRAGDPAVLERIVCCHGDQLRAIGRCRCRTEQEALDAVQDALLAAGEHLDRYRGEGDVVAWVGRMVANACHRMRRGRKNDPRLHNAEAPLRSDADPERDARRRELAAALRAAIEHLSPSDRRLLQLAAVEGYTGPELAEALQISPQAVRARLCRARRKVKKILEEQGIHSADVTQ